MKKQVTKIICATVAAVVATGVAAAAGCSPYNKGVELDYTPSNVSAKSNGGFAVEKDGYVYFINGIADGSTEDNTYGTPVKGSIMRISVDNLNKRNYASAETLVPQIAYSTAYNTGIFVYGDYIYYGTPSTLRNADGVIQSGNLEMKSTKLDGTEAMRDAYVTFPSAAYDYRFVEVDGTVYLMYVATDEKLYEESTGVKNLHSLNTVSGEDTLLAYNISNYVFDAEDKTNPRAYYTMDVYDYSGTSNTTSDYNQVYTVTADTTEANSYAFEEVFGWDEETDHYVNCGDLVFDGIGGRVADSTVFNNKQEDGSTAVNDIAYKYTLQSYQSGSLFYTRSYSMSGSTSTEYLFSVKDSALSALNPIAGNPEDEDAYLSSGALAGQYKYIFDDNGDLSKVIIAESGGGVSVNNVTDGKLSDKINNKDYYRIVGTGTATLLFTDGDYLYYSISGSGNGYSFYRVDYTGEWGDYEGMFPEDAVSPYTSVKILDLDAATDWYAPELIEGNLLFIGETDNMTSYNYVMACNIDGLDNNGLDELNKLYDRVIGDEGLIADYSDTDKYPSDTYANLANAARYLFYTVDIDYVNELAAACNAALEENEDPVYSDNTLAKLKDYVEVAGDWAEFKEYSREVNGETIYANRRDYYYSVIGKMTDADAEAYAEDFKIDYLMSWPEDEEGTTWFGGLSTVARVFFIIGMCLAGLLVIAGVTVLVIFLVRKFRKNNLPDYSKRRIRVDTTDDKSINVYEDETKE